MTENERAAVIGLQRRLSHSAAIARLIAQTDSSDLATAVAGIAVTLSDADDWLDALLDGAKA